LEKAIRLEKRSEHSFFKNVLIASLIILLAAAYPVKVYLSQVQIISIICGYLISLLNAFLGYKLNVMGINKPVKSFMVLVFGGMGLRILILVILLLVLLRIAGLDEVSLVGSAFFFYIVFMTLEVLYFHKKQLNIKTEKSN
jgi:hypothetical protein